MTLKRIVLSILTFIVALEMGASLISSLGQPQVGNQLQLYQTDLLVQASEWDGSGLPENEVQQFRNAVFGKDALDSATEQYQEVRKDSATGLVRLQQKADLAANKDSAQQITATARSQQQLIDQVDLRLGMVQAQQGDVAKAIETWQKLAQRTGRGTDKGTLVASTLIELWQDPPVVRLESEAIINDNLRGWFRYSALERLYTLKEKPTLLSELRETERNTAEQTLIQLSVVGILPSLGGLLGTAGLIALVGQRMLKGKESILAVPERQWEVPWNWEVIWQVVVGGFLFVGQIVLPLMLQLGLAAQSSLLVPEVAAVGSDWLGFGWLGLRLARLRLARSADEPRQGAVLAGVLPTDGSEYARGAVLVY